MNDSYRTISNQKEPYLLREKGSKFIAYCYSVSSLEEVKVCLDEVKNEHPSATHHCYAYRLGASGEEYRANDDGEPSGSAGLPIYNQLLSNELTNVLAVVVRYYGGTKLGVSGLIKAYKTATAEALKEIPIIQKYVESEIQIRFSYDIQNQVMRVIDEYGATIRQQEFVEYCQFIVSVRISEQERFVARLLNIDKSIKTLIL